MEEVKKIEAQLRQPVAYRHVTRDANTVADDMARRALEAKTDIVYWDGQVPDDAPPNQLPDIYQQQQPTEQLDWTGVPEDLKLPISFTGTPKTVIASFGPRLTAAANSYMFRMEARRA